MTGKLRILAIAATAAMAISCGVAQAAPPSAQPGDASTAASAGAPARAARAKWRHRFEEQMKRLHAQLKLNADQEKQWQNALTTMRHNRMAFRENRKQLMTQMHQLWQQPILDLAAMRDARNKAMQQNQALRAQTEDAWLQFYGSLDNSQKLTFSHALKEHRKHMEAMRKRWHGWHHGPGAKHPAPASMAAPAAQ
jgi:uncharacterized membrane protein